MKLFLLFSLVLANLCRCGSFLSLVLGKSYGGRVFTRKIHPVIMSTHAELIGASLTNLRVEKNIKNFVKEIKFLASSKSSFRPDDKFALTILVQSHFDSLDGEDLCNIVWSLGVLECTIDYFDKECLSKLYDVITLWSPQLSRMDSLRLLSGLGKIGVKWNSLPPTTSNTILESSLQSEYDSPDGEGREISSILISIGLMDANKTFIPNELINNLTSRLCESMSSQSLTSQGLANSIRGMYKIGFLWDDLSQTFKIEILNSIMKLASGMLRQEICSIIHSLAKIQVMKYI